MLIEYFCTESYEFYVQLYKHLNIMYKSQKKIKGSAIVDQEGGFVFTPYLTKSEEEKTMRLLATTKLCSLWTSGKSYSIRMKFPHTQKVRLTELVAALMEIYTVMEKDRLKNEKECKKGGRL